MAKKSNLIAKKLSDRRPVFPRAAAAAGAAALAAFPAPPRARRGACRDPPPWSAPMMSTMRSVDRSASRCDGRRGPAYHIEPTQRPCMRAQRVVHMGDVGTQYVELGFARSTTFRGARGGRGRGRHRSTRDDGYDDGGGVTKDHVRGAQRQRVVHVRLGAAHVHRRRHRARDRCAARGEQVGIRAHGVFDVLGAWYRCVSSRGV